MKRLVLLGAALLFVFAVWFFFFPVPLGWAARIGIGRALPEGNPLQLKLDSATFRWRWGQPAIALEIRGVDATVKGHPLATVREVMVEVPKTGLRHKHFAPSLISIGDPHVTADQTPDGALTLLIPPTPPASASAKVATTPSTTTTPVSPPDLTALAIVLPEPGASSRLVIEGFSVHLRTKLGEAVLPFGRIETTIAQTPGGVLQLDLALPLTAAISPPRLTASGSLDTHSNRGEFALKMPMFATRDLPVVPGAPPLPLLANVALDTTGHFDFAALRVDDVAGGVIITDADVMLPEHLIAEKVHIERIEFRGHADLRAERASLETGRVQIGALELNIADFETTLGNHIESRWRLDVTELHGSAVARLLPKKIRTVLPLSLDAIRVVTMKRASTHGAAVLNRDAAGVWSSQRMQAEGGVDLTLGSEPLAFTWNAKQAEGEDKLVVEAALPTFVPGRWPEALTAGTPASAIDVPLAFTAETTLSPTGEPRSAKIALTGAPGTLKPLQPNLPPLSVRKLELRVETEQFDRAWRVPVARLELANGAGAELINTRAERAPQQVTVIGDARASGLYGDFISLWLPAGTWDSLAGMGIAPRDAQLVQVGAHFDATIAEHVGGGWQPKAIATTADAEVRLHGVPLRLKVRATLPDSTSQVDAIVDVAEFRPSQLGITLTPGLTTAAADFPLSLHAVAHATLKGALTGIDAEVRAGVGKLKTPPAFGDLDLPIKSLALAANYDPAQQRANVKSLQVDAAGLQLKFADISTNLAPPFRVTGKVELAPFAVRPVLAYWPASQKPDLREMAQTMLRAADVNSAQFDWNIGFNPAATPALEISHVRGTARLAKVELTHAAVPGPIRVGSVMAIVDYPKATLEVQDAAVPGAQLPTARVEVAGLNAAPTANVTAKFNADLAAANRAWKFAPPDLASGITTGEFSAQAPLNAETVDARFTMDMSHAKLELRNLPPVLPENVTATVHAKDLLSPTVPAVANFNFSAGQWLGFPLRAEGSMTLAAGDHHPTLVELSKYEHGNTRLQVKFEQPDDTHRNLSLSGTMLELGPLLRAGLAAADAFAAESKPAATPATSKNSPKPAIAPAVSPKPVAPMTVMLDVQVDRVMFGPRETAGRFELHTRLENNWPASLTLQAGSNSGQALRADLTGPRGNQAFTLSIVEAAGWVKTVTSPWSATPPAAGQFGSLEVNIAKVPALIAGGNVAAALDIRPDEPVWLRGNLTFSVAKLVRPPRIVQLLAWKTGKSLESQPFIKKLSIGDVSLSQTQLSLSNIVLEGTGLIDRIKIKTATLGLLDEKLFVDGEYFGIGFDFHGGTLSNPGLPWLKDDNKLIKAVGVKDEGFFDDPEPAPAPKPKTAPKK